MKRRFMRSGANALLGVGDRLALEPPAVPQPRGSRRKSDDRKAGLGPASFAASIREWQACQDVISAGLTLINQQGIFRGVVKQFENHVAGLASSGHEPETRPQDGGVSCENMNSSYGLNERLPMSTEILESSFLLYKQLEQQHSKSGFTNLLLTFPTLLGAMMPEKEVIASFSRVKVADVKAWTTEHLPSTLASKRTTRLPRTKNQNQKENQKYRNAKTHSSLGFLSAQSG